MMKKQYIITIIVIICTLYLTLGFSAFVSDLSISNMVATVRTKEDVRITDVTLKENINTTLNEMNYDKDSIISDIKFENINSYIIYNITLTNIGNIETGIYSISVPNGISYELINYNLKEKICNTDNSCSLGISKEISIKIYPTTVEDLQPQQIKIDFEYRFFHKITYTNITNNNYPTSIIDGDTLNVILKNPPEFVNVYESGVEVERNKYTYNNSNGNFIYENVKNDLVIERAESTLLEGRTFSKALKDFVNNTTESAYNSTETTVTYIGIFEDEIPPGYTEEKFFQLPSLSVSDNNRITAYNDNGKIYIYSKDDILAPENAYSLFRGYSNLTELNISKLNTKKVTDMGAMFQDNISLKYLDISTFNTTNVYRLFYTFYNCQSLKELKLPAFNKKSLTNIQSVFANNYNLESLNLSNWDTSGVSLMGGTFENCYKLSSLNLSGWNTSKVTDMSYMFRYNQSLTSLDISMFNTSNVTNMSRMFGYCDKLENIYVGSAWDTSKVTESVSMFSTSPLLPGFDPNYVDVSKAYVGEGGYLKYLPQ